VLTEDGLAPISLCGRRCGPASMWVLKACPQSAGCWRRPLGSRLGNYGICTASPVHATLSASVCLSPSARELILTRHEGGTVSVSPSFEHQCARFASLCAQARQGIVNARPGRRRSSAPIAMSDLQFIFLPNASLSHRPYSELFSPVSVLAGSDPVCY
jgi:hypothetical protein